MNKEKVTSPDVSTIKTETINTQHPDYDIISMDEALKELEMKKRLIKSRAMHPYKIYHSEKSGYFTKVADETATNGFRKIRKSTEEKLWEALAEWYIDNSYNNTVTLTDIYAEWIQWKTTPTNAANIKRIEAEWSAYYDKEPLSRSITTMPLRKITALDLRNWAEALMKKHQPDRKKFYRMFSIVDHCYEYAADEDRAIITANLWKKAKKKLNPSLIVKRSTPSDDTQVFTDEERRLIKRMVYDDLQKYKKQASSAGLQILFLLETGLRIGECCGLKYNDIKDNSLYVSRQADNNGVKDKVKTSSGYRVIPLTQEAKRILEDIKSFNLEHGYTAEWIFQSNNPKYDYRLSYNAADKKLRKLCARMDTVSKSPHKCRKTVLSALLDDPDVNNRTVQRFAGHADISTTLKYYDFDRASKEAQAIAINKALAL